MSLRVFLAGRVAVEVDGRPIDEDRFAGRQGRLVFAYLVMEHDRAVPHEELAEAIWDGSPPTSWRKALSVIVSKVRAMLAGCAIDGPDVLKSAFGCYRLELPPGSWVDVLEAIDSVQKAEQTLAAGELEASDGAARRAASLARPQFLPGDEGAWVDAKRRELFDVLRRALACLADASLLSGRSSEAVKWAEEAIALEPFRETGYRRLMDAHAAAGNRAEALRVYERCRLLLAQELGAYPSPETESIYRRLLGGPAPTPAPEREPSRSPGGPEQTATALNGGVLVSERSKRGRVRVALAVTAAGAVAALIAVIVIGFTEEASPTLARVQDNAVGIVDPRSRAIVDEAAGIASPQRIAVGEGSIWVTSSSGGGSVARLDPGSHDVTDTIAVGHEPVGIAVGAGAVWVANSLDGTVSRIDPASGDEVDTIEVGNTPTGVAFGVGAVWVTNTDDRTISKIDPLASAGAAPQTIDVDAAARWVAVGGGAVWVTDTAGNAVVRVDLRLRTVTRIAVGSGPTAVAYGNGAVWVTNSLDGTVSRIDARREVVTDTVTVGAAPNGIAVAEDGVWVTTEVGGTLVHVDRAFREPAVTMLGGRPEGVTIADGSIWIAVQATGAAHRGGTLRMIGEIDSIDPALAYTPSAAQLLSEVYDGLVAYKRVGGTDGNTLVPNLARALPSVTDDGKTYTFRLRPGIRFADGTELRASAVLYSLERLFRAHTAPPPPIESSEFLSYFEGIVGAPACTKQPKRCALSKGVVTDDATGIVTISLRAPDPDFLHKLTFASVVPIGTPDVVETPIPGTGPYRIAEYKPARRLRLVRNPHFKEWSKAAKPQGLPDRIVVELAETSGDEAVTAVQRGRVDVIGGVSPDRLQELRIRYAGQLHVTPRAGTYFLLLNTKRPPFDDVRARQAVAYAVDRGRLVEGFGGGEFAAPACQLLPPNFPGYDRYCPHTASPTEGGAWTAPDLERARRLVAESGTKGMRVDVVGLAESGGFTAMTTVLNETLRRLGYRTFPQWLPFEAFLDAFPDVARAEASQQGWLLDYPAASGFMSVLLSCTGNPYGCNDPAVDRRLRHARELQARNHPGAKEAWTRLERYVVDQAIVVPVITPNATNFVSKRVRNYQRHPVYGMLISQVWLEPRRQSPG